MRADAAAAKYIQREPNADDVSATRPCSRRVGAVARPPRTCIFRALLGPAERGVHFSHVTLHVGAGTFQPGAWTTSANTMPANG